MKIISPLTITDAILISSSVTEADYAAYNAGTTYAAGNRVIVVATHKIYESAQSSNLNHYPPDNLTGATPWWLEVGATNRWRMLDRTVGSQTTNSNSIVVAVDSSNMASLTLINVDAISVSIEVTDEDTSTVVYDETIDLLTSLNVIDAFSYCFGEFYYTRNVSLNIPLYPDSTTEVTLDYTGGTAKCGELLLGTPVYLGCTQLGASVGITDYSVKQVDDFGTYTILQRAFSKKGNFDVLVDNTQLEYIVNMLSELRSTPVIWIATDAQYLSSPLMIYGFYKDFTLVIQYASDSMCSLEIEGLT